jgi:hypothetical protein
MPSPAVASGASLVRLLYTQNPFYLIGTLLVLVGLQQSLGGTAGLSTSGLLTGLLAAYTLLLAAIAATIIGYGRVWEDARTILLVIVLLFFMLSASLDVQLNTEPVAGSLLLFGGLAFSLLVSEGLLRGLKIALAWRYRGPFYLLLALLFAWPMVPAWLAAAGAQRAASWSVLGFPLAAAIALLTLVPAARTPAKREPSSGTPWPWPMFPWSLFVFLTIGIALRSWWLSISFEPASGTDGSFRAYFLVPIVLAWSVLITEMGAARRSADATAFGMLLPLASLALAFPGYPSSPVAAARLFDLAETVGSPAQLTSWGLVAFYASMWLARRPTAETLCLASLAVAGFVGPETVGLASLSRPQALPLGLLAAMLLGLGIWRQSTPRLIAGGTLLAMGVLARSPELAAQGWFWKWHAPLLALAALPIVLNDEWARWLRDTAWRAVPLLAFIAAIGYPWVPGIRTVDTTTYLGLLMLVAAGLWQRERGLGQLVAALSVLGANLLGGAAQVYELLGRSILAKGLPWLAAGLVLVAIALAISLAKMGLLTRLEQALQRLNRALGGPMEREA